jgi:NADPH:quinone reductase-like Zn-dependent oxidoreductase
MRAAIFRHHGGPEVLEIEEARKPVIQGTKRNDLAIVNVKSAALNHLDIVARQGLPGVKIPLPHISGTDIAGVVEQSTSEDSSAVGAKVVVYPATFCGLCRMCLSGQENLCPEFKLIGFFSDGGFAEYVRVPARNLFPIPKGMTFDEASSIPLVFLTAWHSLVTIGKVSKEDVVLIPSAGSGLGIACIEVATYLGARIVATVGARSKAERLKSFGVTAIVGRSPESISNQLLSKVKKSSIDVIIDHIGGSNWKWYPSLLKARSRIISVGSTAGSMINMDLSNYYLKESSVLGSYVGSVREFRQVLRMFERKKFTPVIDSIHPLSQIREAEKKLEERTAFGKIVLTI